MTTTEMLQKLNDGTPIMKATFLNHKLEHGSGRDPETGRSRTWQRAVLNCMTDHSVFAITNYLPDGFDTSTYVVPAKRGENVCILLEGMSKEKGGVVIKGQIYPITDDAPAKAGKADTKQ